VIRGISGQSSGGRTGRINTLDEEREEDEDGEAGEGLNDGCRSPVEEGAVVDQRGDEGGEDDRGGAANDVGGQSEPPAEAIARAERGDGEGEREQLEAHERGARGRGVLGKEPVEPRRDDGDEGGGAGTAPKHTEERGVEHRQQALAQTRIFGHGDQVDQERKEQRKGEEDADFTGGGEREETGGRAGGGVGGHGGSDAGFSRRSEFNCGWRERDKPLPANHATADECLILFADIRVIRGQPSEGCSRCGCGARQ